MPDIGYGLGISFRNGDTTTPCICDAILLESGSGDFLLQEDGIGKFLLES